ncbi:MAG: hypothetical protein ACTSRG_03320 [Candidatus Helarchaeota archaeon]
MASTDFLTGYLIAKLVPSAGLPPETIALIGGTIIAAVVIVIGLIFCWDLGKQANSDLSKIGWVIIFFILPVYSWIAYYLIIKKG